MTRILVTGAAGLVGTDLVARLQNMFSPGQVIATDISGPFTFCDVRDLPKLDQLISHYRITQVYHLAGLLSVGGEKNPSLAWDVNINGLKNVLQLGNKYHLQIFWPSSIAAFGPSTPNVSTPQHTILEPTTIYGISKVAGELLCQYYFSKFGVDVRSLRFPGLIAWKAPPGDGTTEYAVHIFHAALKANHYTCFLQPDTVLPMMFIDDAITGTINLMAAPADNISVRTAYNFSALSFSPGDLVAEIKKIQPDFSCDYAPDSRQAIADSWPRSIDDSVARSDWGWQPKYDLSRLVRIMFENLGPKYVKN